MNINLLRFFNFIIDNIIFTFLVFIFLYIFSSFISKENAVVILFIFYFFYYFLQELIWKRTIAKYITKTIITTKLKSEKYFFWQILFRTLVRFIIIDVFSYLFTNCGLHDFLSKTETIKDKNN
jgi:uncharacterized RDD family membrane protein YckC